MGAPAARVSELSRHWAKMGHEVTVLTGFPNFPTGVVAPEYRSRIRRLVATERLDGVRVVRTWLWPLPNRRARERMLNYASFCVSSAWTGLFLSRPDVVIASSPQLLVGLSGWWLARVKRVPFVLEVRDLWPESLTAVGMGDSGSALHRSLAKLAGFLYREAEKIVVVTEAFKDHLVKRWAVPPEKIGIVENGVETAQFCPAQPDPSLRKQLGTEEKFVVCYIGTIGMAHGLETLVEAAARLKAAAPGVHFVVVGEGAEKENVAAMARARKLDNLQFLDQQPRALIPRFITTSDACLVMLKRTPLFKTVIPSKMLEFMSCGRPLILAVDGQARKILQEAKAGIFVEPEDVEALTRAVLRLSTDRGLCEALGRGGRQHVMRYFSRDEQARHYLEIL
jgi:glycosyltransferase involved in cell wall biosynthesis